MKQESETTLNTLYMTNKICCTLKQHGYLNSHMLRNMLNNFIAFVIELTKNCYFGDSAGIFFATPRTTKILK